MSIDVDGATDKYVSILPYEPYRRYHQKSVAITTLGPKFTQPFQEVSDMRNLFAVASAIILMVNTSQAQHKDDDIVIYPSAELKWQAVPPSLPNGAKIVVLEGDPRKEGPFVFRVKVPDGYQVPPHTHPKPERITVISGTFNIGMGDKFDKSKGRVMPAGTYGQWPPGMKHYVWTKGETVLQFHGFGPWTIKYVNPADDPRNQKKGDQNVSQQLAGFIL